MATKKERPGAPGRRELLRCVVVGRCFDLDLAGAVLAHLGGLTARGAARKFSVAETSVRRVAGEIRGYGKQLVEWGMQGQEGA